MYLNTFRESYHGLCVFVIYNHIIKWIFIVLLTNCLTEIHSLSMVSRDSKCSLHGNPFNELKRLRVKEIDILFLL